MAAKSGSKFIRWFLLKKLLREFKLPYIRALGNYSLFSAMRLVERFSGYKFIRHRFVKPVALMVQINKVCNFSCSFCFINELNEKGAKEFSITPEIFERMLDQPLLNSLTRIGFTGGEPLLHPNLFDYIDKAKQTVPAVSVNTNFALAGRVMGGERRIDRLNRSALDMLSISLYQENVEHVEEFAPQLANRFLKRLSFVVSNGPDKFHNYTRMYEVAEMATRLGFHHLHYQNYDNMEGVSAQNANLNKMDVSGFLPLMRDEKYLNLKERVQADFGDKVAISFPVLKKKLDDPLRSFSCYQPDFQIGVDAKGNLSPCCNMDRLPEYGNLFTDDNWNNEMFQRIRAGIKKRGIAPTPFCANCTYLDVNLHDT